MSALVYMDFVFGVTIAAGLCVCVYQRRHRDPQSGVGHHV